MAGRRAGFAGRRRDFPYRREAKGKTASGGVRGMLRFSLGWRKVPPAFFGQSGDGGRFCSALSPQEEESPLRCGAGEGTFRLFPMRSGWLTAYRAVNIAAAHWKFARKLARPPSWFRVTWVALERFRPYCFPVRAGWGYGWRFFAFFVRSIFVRRVWLRRALPAPAKEP